MQNGQEKLFYEQKNVFLQNKNPDETLASVIKKTAQSFIGYPYIEHSLEVSENEDLVVNLKGFDCTTFVETVLALSRTFIVNEDYNYFKKELSGIRYRNGIMNGYCSRLHYFSEWISDNVKKKIVKDITRELEGEKKTFDVSYMSSNPKFYSALISSPERIDTIRNIEKRISELEFYVIPKHKIKIIEAKINEGDIIAFTTSFSGLDVGHIGIAVRDSQGKLNLIHAPSAGKLVQITNKPLSDYIINIKKHTGIIVAHPLLN